MCSNKCMRNQGRTTNWIYTQGFLNVWSVGGAALLLFMLKKYFAMTTTTLQLVLSKPKCSSSHTKMGIYQVNKRILWHFDTNTHWTGNDNWCVILLLPWNERANRTSKKNMSQSIVTFFLNSDLCHAQFAYTFRE